MAEAKVSSDRWVLDADLERQKEEQTSKVSTGFTSCNNRPAIIAGAARTVTCAHPQPLRPPVTDGLALLRYRNVDGAAQPP